MTGERVGKTKREAQKNTKKSLRVSSEALLAITVQCLPVSNDEMEEGDPGSDSDFEIHTKKEVRHKLENID